MVRAPRTRRHRFGVVFIAAVALVAFAAGPAQAATQSPTELATTPTGTPTVFPTEVPAPPETLTPPGVDQPVQTPRTGRPGFVLDGGRYTRFDAPDARVGTSPIGINNRGVIVGKYNDGTEVTGSGASEHGFIRGTRGRFTTIDVPGARSTALTRINDRRQMVGIYSNTTGRVGDDPSRRAFLLEQGRFTRIHAPDAVYTQAFGINNDTYVVGEFVDTSGNGHGFLWKNGRFTTIDVPGSAYTAALDINDRGKIVGIHVRDLTAEPLKVHGFVLDRGRYTTFDAPDVAITYPSGNNNKGQIVGDTSNDAAVTSQGFLLRKGIDGPYTPINVAGSPRTSPTDINDDRTIIGVYQNVDAEWDPAAPGTQPMTMMSDMWESMAFAQDLAEQRADDEADKPKDTDQKQRKDRTSKRRRQPSQSGASSNDKRPAKKPSSPAQDDQAKMSSKPEQRTERSRTERSSTKDRPPTERARREPETRREVADDQRVYRVAPATDRQPVSSRAADDDTSTITAEPSNASSEPTGVIRIQAADNPPQDLDRTAEVSQTANRMTARGMAVAVPVAVAWVLMMMTRRRLRGLGRRETTPSAVQEPPHPTGFWHGRRTPSGRHTVTCRPSDIDSG